MSYRLPRATSSVGGHTKLSDRPSSQSMELPHSVPSADHGAACDTSKVDNQPLSLLYCQGNHLLATLPVVPIGDPRRKAHNPLSRRSVTGIPCVSPVRPVHAPPSATWSVSLPFSAVGFTLRRQLTPTIHRRARRFPLRNPSQGPCEGDEQPFRRSRYAVTLWPFLDPVGPVGPRCQS